MRNLLLILATISGFTPLAQASPWSEIEKDSVIRLKEDLQVSSTLMLPKDSRFAVNDVEFFGPPYLEVISLRLFPCPDSLANQRHDLAILEDSYGFEMDWNCKISMFLEVRDFYRESYFETVE
jgi:endo-1,4-beta-D-glucanase Y